MAITMDARDGYAPAGPSVLGAERARALAFRQGTSPFARRQDAAPGVADRRGRHHRLLCPHPRRELEARARASQRRRGAADRRRPDHEEPELFRPHQRGRPLRGAGQESDPRVQQGCADQAHRCRRRSDAGQWRRHQPQGQAWPARQRQERARAVRRHRDRGEQRPEGAPVARQGVQQGASGRLQASRRGRHADRPRTGRDHDHAHRYQGDDLRRRRRRKSQGIDASRGNDADDACLRPRLASAGRRDVRAALRQRCRQDGAVHGRRGGRAGRLDLEVAQSCTSLTRARPHPGWRARTRNSRKKARGCRGSLPRKGRW